jgi:hypothetical protein
MNEIDLATIVPHIKISLLIEALAKSKSDVLVMY